MKRLFTFFMTVAVAGIVSVYAQSLQTGSTSEPVKRCVAVEEYTGTACGWCPRGIVGMEQLRKEFGDQFVGIAVHQYNSGDPMYINPNAYASIGFTGAPSCALDRRYITDPYYGNGNDIADDFRAVLALPAEAGVEVEGVWNEDSTSVQAVATIMPLVDGSAYSVEFVLIADSLTGTATSWTQQNYYYQYTPAQADATGTELAQFCKGGENGKSSVKGWIFNDVAIKSSYVSNVNQAPGVSNLTAGVEATSEYTLTLPTKTTLKKALRKDYIYVAALLVDANGIIVNSAKALVHGAGITDGIKTVQSVNVIRTPARYSLDGRQLQQSAKGLNILRQADGTVKKVIVK